jgi:hypothetical protein
MPDFPLALFAAASDPEAARYRILARLQDARGAFTRSCVYPHLAELVRVRRAVAELLDGLDRHRSAARPGPAVGVDWEAMRIVHASDEPPLLAEDLARWALPLLDAAIDEGRTLYEFADAHAALAAVGLVPAYKSEGFLIVPSENAAEPLRALRYQISALAGADGEYRSLCTTPVDVQLDPLAPPATWKERLTAASPDLPTPATFRLDADVPFPAEETLVPLAKRKLLAFVRAWGEA